MAENIPLWLNETFLQSILQGENSDTKVEILNYSAYPAVESGNNYLSQLYRVSVDYKIEFGEKSTSLIIKVPIESGFLVEMIGPDFFIKEPTIYKELLPMMKNKMQYQFGPESFYSPLKNGMVLSDLKVEGYIMCDRFKQLDYEHCSKVVVNIAKFHAASVVCFHDNPDLIRLVGKEGLYPEDSPLNEEDNKKSVNAWISKAVEIVSKEDNCESSVSYITERTEELADRKSFVKVFKPKQNGLNVLNHGDLWVNNIMFKHDGAGKVLDVKFIDYQIARYASPVLDVMYFIWTSANKDVRESNIKSLFDTYLETLNDTLEKLECEERMTEKEMKEDLRSSINYGLVIIFQSLPFILCDVENVINMEEVSVEDMKGGLAEEKFKKVYEGKHYRALLPTMLRQFQSWTSSLEE